jgi:hypothetical protein
MSPATWRSDRNLSRPVRRSDICPVPSPERLPRTTASDPSSLRFTGKSPCRSHVRSFPSPAELVRSIELFGFFPPRPPNFSLPSISAALSCAPMNPAICVRSSAYSCTPPCMRSDRALPRIFPCHFHYLLRAVCTTPSLLHGSISLVPHRGHVSLQQQLQTSTHSVPS